VKCFWEKAAEAKAGRGWEARRGEHWSCGKSGEVEESKRERDRDEMHEDDSDTNDSTDNRLRSGGDDGEILLRLLLVRRAPEQIGRLAADLRSWAEEEEQKAKAKAAEMTWVFVGDPMELLTLPENEPTKISGDNDEEMMIEEEVTKEKETKKGDEEARDWSSARRSRRRRWNEKGRFGRRMEDEDTQTRTVRRRHAIRLVA
jgi:hypothetical protein